MYRNIGSVWENYSACRRKLMTAKETDAAPKDKLRVMASTNNVSGLLQTNEVSSYVFV